MMPITCHVNWHSNYICVTLLIYINHTTKRLKGIYVGSIELKLSGGEALISALLEVNKNEVQGRNSNGRIISCIS